MLREQNHCWHRCDSQGTASEEWQIGESSAVPNGHCDASASANGCVAWHVDQQGDGKPQKAPQALEPVATCQSILKSRQGFRSWIGCARGREFWN